MSGSHAQLQHSLYTIILYKPIGYFELRLYNMGEGGVAMVASSNIGGRAGVVMGYR